jgi:gluconate kinase
MAKKRLKDIAEDYNIPFEEAMDIAFNNLTEESITGRGKNTWIDEVGQDLLEDTIPMAIKKARVYRGRIRNKAPNPRFVFVHIKEKNGVVPVKMSPRYAKMTRPGQFIHVEEEVDDRYVMIDPKIV